MQYAAAHITPYLADSYVSPPCMNAVYGSRIGPSAESSIDEPPVKAPAAITTGSSYPGISHGSGIT